MKDGGVVIPLPVLARVTVSLPLVALVVCLAWCLARSVLLTPDSWLLAPDF